jgi:hypothetical protein
MSQGMSQDTTLTNRRRAWRRLLSRRRQKIPYMYSRWASGCPTTRHYRTDVERRDTYRRKADFNSKSSQEKHRSPRSARCLPTVALRALRYYLIIQSVSRVSDYELDDRVIEVRSPIWADFFSSPCVQTGSGAHPASYTMGTRGSFPGGKAWPKRDADHSPPSSAEVKNE